MKRVLLPIVLGVPIFLVALWLTAPPAHATKNFQETFVVHYVAPCDNDLQEAAKIKAMLAEAVGETKCNICHAGRNKKLRNAYGDQLAKLLDKKSDAENTKKVIAVLETVGQIKLDPKDENSPTYGELLAQGRLPAQSAPSKK